MEIPLDAYNKTVAKKLLAGQQESVIESALNRYEPTYELKEREFILYGYVVFAFQLLSSFGFMNVFNPACH